MSALAEVLAAHYMSLGVQGGWYCLCGATVGHYSDVSTHAADALTKAGFGKLAEARAAELEACAEVFHHASTAALTLKDHAAAIRAGAK